MIYYVSSTEDVHASAGNAGTPEDPMGLNEAMQTAVAGDTIYVKADGEYVLTGALKPLNSGTSSSPIRMVGYANSVNDRGLAYLRGSNATNSGGDHFGLIDTSNPARYYWHICNFELQKSGLNSTLSLGMKCTAQNCVIRNLRTVPTPGSAIYIGRNCALIDVVADSPNGFVAHHNVLIRCRFTTAGACVTIENYSTLHAFGCVFRSTDAASNLINLSAPTRMDGLLLANNVFVGGYAAIGGNAPTVDGYLFRIANNVCWGQAGYAFNPADEETALNLYPLYFNAAGGFGLGRSSLAVIEEQPIALETDPFVNLAGGDYRIAAASAAYGKNIGIGDAALSSRAPREVFR